VSSNVVVNLLLRTEAARLAGVDGHVCELQLTPRIFAEAAVTQPCSVDKLYSNKRIQIVDKHFQ
jgi:hypothetical protein